MNNLSAGAVSYADVPQELKASPNWVVWTLEERDGKKTKVPSNAKNGKLAKSNDPSTWATFQQAMDAVDIISGNAYTGIGFMLQGTPYAGLDFDGVIHPEPNDPDRNPMPPEPYVLEILKHLGNPYYEATPSNCGVRAFVECAQLPQGQRKFSADKYGAEIYIGNEGGRYLTITGNKLGGDGIPKVDDISLPYLLISQIRNKRFKQLWLGDISGNSNDHSAADYALFCMLAELLGPDVNKILATFKESKLWRPERWGNREDYLRTKTIPKAIGKAKFSEAFFDEAAASTTSPVDEQGGAFELLKADTIPPKRVNWFWPSRVPLGKITLYVGNPDNGKSISSIDLAAVCTTGRDFPDAKNTLTPSEVLMFVGEDDLDDTAVPRLTAAGADLSKIFFCNVVKKSTDREREVRLDWDINKLDQTLEANPNVRLIIIDPITNYLGETHMSAEQDVRSNVLIPLKRVAERHNVAIVFVMHLNKKSDLDAISRVGGAMAFIGVARCSWLFSRDEEGDKEGSGGEKLEKPETFSMVRLKNNLAKSSNSGLQYTITTEEIRLPDGTTTYAPRLVWGQVIDKSANEALGNHPARAAGRPRENTTIEAEVRAVKWLLEYLQDGEPKPAKALVDDAVNGARIGRKKLDAAATTLKVKIYKEGKTWFWQMRPIIATRETVQSGQSALVAVPA